MDFSIAALSDPQGWANLLIPYGLKLIGALAIFVIGRWVAKLIVAAMKKSMGRARADETIVDFLGTLAYIGLMAFVVIAALGQLGVKTTAAAAILGGAAIAVGLSLQGQLSALASGVMLILFRPFRKGDFVLAGGEYGTVEAVRIVNTLLVTTNNQEVTIPNNIVWSGPITNFSARDTRRMDLTVSVSLQADLDRAMAVLREIIDADDRVLAEPAPAIRANAVTGTGVDILFRPWYPRTEFWDAYWDNVAAIKKRFEAEGIDFAQQRHFIQLASADNKAA